MAIDIPKNPYSRSFKAEVEAAVAAVFKEMGDKPGQRVGCLSVNHGCSHFHVRLDVADEVACMFKARGYFAHYCHATDGTAHTLEITTYPTDYDV